MKRRNAVIYIMLPVCLLLLGLAWVLPRHGDKSRTGVTADAVPEGSQPAGAESSRPELQKRPDPVAKVEYPDKNVKDGIKLTIRAKNSECRRSDDHFIVSLTLENVSGEIIKLYFSRCDVEHVHLLVYNESDNLICQTNARHGRPCEPRDAKLLILKPGNLYSWEEDADGLLGTAWVPPGNIKIRYKYSVPQWWHKDGYIGEGFWEGDVLSNAVDLVKYDIDPKSKDNTVTWLKVRR